MHLLGVRQGNEHSASCCAPEDLCLPQATSLSRIPYPLPTESLPWVRVVVGAQRSHGPYILLHHFLAPHGATRGQEHHQGPVLSFSLVLQNIPT